jgi:hypothetical protein
LHDIDEDDNEKTNLKTKKHKWSREHKKHRSYSVHISSRKTLNPILEVILGKPSRQSPVLFGFTQINKSRKQNPVPPPMRTDQQTPLNTNLAPSDTEGIFPSNWEATLTDPNSFPDFGSELSEPYISDDQDPATGPARGPLAAVCTVSSERTGASPEPLVRMTVLMVSATPPPHASTPRKNVARKIIVQGQVLSRSKSSAVRSIGPAIGLVGSTTLSPAPVSAPPKALVPETATFKPRCPAWLFSSASPSELTDHPLPVRQRQIRPEPSPIVQETSLIVQETSLIIQETSSSGQEISSSSRAFQMTQATKAKMTLGLLNPPKVYTSIRKGLKAEMQNVGWVNKNSSGLTAFNALCLYLMNLFHGSIS